MHWKSYRNLPAEQKRDEAYYIIGLDIGNDSSGIAFFNAAENAAEAIDLSGGYGKPSIPTVMQYIEETREWVYGEYAILNRGVGAEITLNDLMRRLGQFDYIDIAHKPMSVVSILGLFLKEMLGNVRNINPKAEIVGIVAAVPAYFSAQARSELERAFKSAGYERELIALVSDRECIFAHHYAHQAPGENPAEERVMLLDYGSREVRGGVYHVQPTADTLAITSISSLFDERIGNFGIVNDVCDLFASYLQAQQNTPLTKQQHEQISAFAYQHKDMLFQKAIRAKPAKLYFNFAYPPFQQTLTYADAEALSTPYAKRFDRFIYEVMQRNVNEEEIRPGDLAAVLCVGGGFEMLWAREAVGAVFSPRQLRFHRNAKLITAEGAALVAAARLGVLAGAAIQLEDCHQLTVDIGLHDGNNFLTLVERNAFWWQKHSDKLVLVNQLVENSLRLQLAIRSASGDIHPLRDVELVDLPPRPKGTTRLALGLAFTSHRDATVHVRDMGFGELFPKTDYEEAFGVRLT